MALKVKKVVNKTDVALDVIDKAKKSVERVPKHSSKPVPNESLLDLTFISKTTRPIYIKFRSITGDGGIGDGPGIEVEAGDPEQEETP